MRVISGKYKGKKILRLNSNLLRPTSDSLKETLFNLIVHKYKEFLLNNNFLDIFAGSGAIALEAISRGAKSVTLIESNFNHYTLIKKNFLNIPATVIFKNFLHTHKSLFKQSYSLVYLDPPYNLNLLPTSLNHLLNLNILTNPALIITESKKNTFNPSSILPTIPLEILLKKNIGIKEVYFLKYSQST